MGLFDRQRKAGKGRRISVFRTDYPMDHKIFVESLLLWNGTEYEWDGNRIVAHFPAKLGISFEQTDSFMRISAMKSL